MNTENKVQSLRGAVKAVDRAQFACLEKLARLFPPGTEVRWDRGQGVQRGEVLRLTATGCIVRNHHTGTEQPIIPANILAAYSCGDS